ncbi:MAG: hypothetical protein LBS56_07235 [Propionibacteriaceae bacterium]|jgi:hypothetical protein|nr:hypothetical protein [Propionibacteriaceae bacterium]
MSRNSDKNQRRARQDAARSDQPDQPAGPVFPVWTADQPAAVITVTPPDRLSVRVFGVDREVPDASMGRRDQMGRLMDWLYAQIGQPFTAQIIEADGTVATGQVGPAPDPGPRPPAPPVSADPATWAQPDPAPDPGPLPQPAWAPTADDTANPATTETGQPTTAHAPAARTGPDPARPSGRHAAAAPPDAAATAGPGTGPDMWGGWWRHNTAATGEGFIPGEEVVLALAVAGEAAAADGTAFIGVPRRVVEGLPTGEVILFGRTSGTVALREPLADSPEPR